MTNNWEQTIVHTLGNDGTQEKVHISNTEESQTRREKLITENFQNIYESTTTE